MFTRRGPITAFRRALTVAAARAILGLPAGRLGSRDVSLGDMVQK